MMSSVNHDEFAHLKIPLEDILSATNNFADENFWGDGWCDKRYKGQLLWSGELINIHAGRWLNKEWDDEKEQQFWTEISMLSSLKHKNLVSLVGFCDENDEKVIIIRLETRGGLHHYLSDPMFLTWVRRLEISLGVAHALSYIHYDESRDFSVIHRKITSGSVLLNDDWEPKLSCFERSMSIEASKRHHSFNNGACPYFPGYVDSTFLKANTVNHKSDMYSFGIVLFELLCGRTSIIDSDSNKYLAPLAVTHYREKRLDEIIDWNLRNQMDSHSFNIFAETAYDCLNEEQSQRPNIDEIVTRLEKAMVLQFEHQKAIISKEFAHLRVPLANILSATNNFAQQNIIGETARFDKRYKGQLVWSGELINIRARRWLNKEWDDEKEQRFWTEISMLSSLKHKNVVSLVGFCDENDEKIIIYKLTRGSLSNYLSDPMLLTWVRRLEISVGIAHALSYIHYDEPHDFSVIHRVIASDRVQLNDDWEPKLCDFEFSMKIKASQRHHSFHTNRLWYVEGYRDPIYIETKSENHKSDMYSLGIVLFELLCGRKAVSDDQDNKYLGPVAIFHYKKKILKDIVDPNLWKQMDPRSFKLFADIGHDCLNEERSRRPSIDEIITRLEKALKLQLESAGKSLEHLKIGLTDIKLATENFAKKYRIGSGGYGNVYKAQLEHFDSSNWSSIEGVNKCDLPKRRSTVAIKHIFNPEGKQGFITEIETLTSCKHDNIISLLGFCDEGPDHMILIYEFASRGSLESYIESDDKTSNLTWVQRIKICLNIAHGLKYIHTDTDQDKQKIIHRDIKSANILLGENWEAKIADFGLSKIHPADQEASTLNANTIAGTPMYFDPEYKKYGRLNKKSDIYSFGVVLFEILTGRLASDRIYTKVNEKGIAPIARDHFEKGTIMEIVDHKIKEEPVGHVFSLSKGPNKDSLDIFSKIAYRCLVETQAQRPTIDDVIHELQRALQAQEKSQKENFKMSLDDIQSATQNFSDDNIVGRGGFGNVYKGVASHANGHTIIAAKRLNRTLFGHGETGFFKELDIPLKYKHENVIGLVGYCDDETEKIILHEFARGRLDGYLSDASLTWVMRLKICIDIASGLNFLHATDVNQEVVIHRDIKSSNVLLFDDWKAKITGFGLSMVCPINQDIDHVTDDAAGTVGYSDPLYSTTRLLTKEYDIFSLGAVLFDILCGKLSSVKLDDEYQFLPFLAKHHYQVGKLDELVFEGIKGQIYPQSFDKFARIAYQCLHHRRERRPKADEVVIELKNALEIQEDHELWEPKLPRDYKEIIQKSKCPEIYSTIKKEDLYNTFSKGILLQQDQVLLSFDGNGERNEMVSATSFSYVNRFPHERKFLPESRFETVVEILDVSDMNIEIKTRAQFLSPDVVYGVYLVFKFGDSRNRSSKLMYVNLKYRKGHENLHAYFATWRDEQWMMIELDRFLNQNEDVVFEFLLENFSSYYCGDAEVFVEGIEFRVIDKVKHEGIGKLTEVQQVLKSNFDVDQVRQLPTDFKEIFKINRNYEELFWLGIIGRRKLLIVSAKAALQNVFNERLFSSKSSSDSRFQEMVEVLPQRIFYIKCTIKSQMLSPYTEYACYLVFKLSDKYEGLHCPVKVQDVLHHENNKAPFLYFINPSPLNIHDTRVPKQRKDGWMEIQLWKFYSYSEFKDDTLSMNMKFTSLEGTMSGLIVCGLEFRPM